LTMPVNSSMGVSRGQFYAATTTYAAVTPSVLSEKAQAASRITTNNSKNNMEND